MLPINEFIVKIASRCNINCDYCYEYNLGDESWRTQPKRMSQKAMFVLANRIAEHVQEHSLSDVFVTFHGGEPLLAGSRALADYCDTLKTAISPLCKLHLGIQTNAILLRPDNIEVIREHNILVSVSIDGSREHNDRHRLDHQGRSTFDSTIAGIKLLKKLAPAQLAGILSVIDIRNDPLELFDYLATFDCPSVDFLLPHHTWDRRPPRPNDDPIAYGRWWWILYQAWIADRHPKLEIRFLKNIVSQMAGGPSVVEDMTLTPCQLITIRSDGSIEAVDSMKSTASGHQITDLNIMSASFNEAIRSPMVDVRQRGIDQLCGDCQACPNVSACAGGYFPHRFSKERGFMNRSVYCTDLYWLIDQIRGHLSKLKAA